MKKRKMMDRMELATNSPIDVNEKADKSPIIPQRSKLKTNIDIFQREFTENQKRFIDLAMNKSTKLMFVSGPAGSSKTYMAVYCALMLINLKRMSDIIYVRSVVESSDAKIGFLPGELSEKMTPYLDPLVEKLEELLPKGDTDLLIKDNRVTGIPIGFLRGRNFNAKVIICDEAQNTSFKELLTLITRTGQFSKVFVLGDPGQSDINGKSGFTKMASLFDDEEDREQGIHYFKFTTDDIVRSGLVQYIIKKLEKLK